MKTKQLTIGLGMILLVGFNSCQKTLESTSEAYLEENQEAELLDLSMESSGEESKDAKNSEELFGLTFDERQDSIRKLKQHAKLEIEVEKLLESTLSIEKNVIDNKGFILKSLHYTDVYESKTTEKGDSLITVKKLQNKGEILVRVPRKNIRNTLDNIQKELKFINHRLLENEDLTFKFKEEELSARRAKIYRNDLQNLTNENGDLDHKIELAETKANAGFMRDYAKLEIEKVEDSIAFATIEISIIGETEIRIRKESNFDEYAKLYSASFFETAGRNLKNGWNSFLDVFLFLLNFWVFFLIVGFIISLIVYRSKKETKQPQ